MAVFSPWGEGHWVKNSWHEANWEPVRAVGSAAWARMPGGALEQGYMHARSSDSKQIQTGTASKLPAAAVSHSRRAGLGSPELGQ